MLGTRTENIYQSFVLAAARRRGKCCPGGYRRCEDLLSGLLSACNDAARSGCNQRDESALHECDVRFHLGLPPCGAAPCGATLRGAAPCAAAPGALARG